MSPRRNDQTLYRERDEAWWDEDDPFARSLREVDRLRQVVLRRVLAGLPPRPRVVDVGCGGGLLAAPLARRGARVLGLDPEAAGLAAAGRRGVACALADGRRLPLADASADLVCLADVVEHVPAWPAMLREAARVARPGGRCYVSTIAAGPLGRILAVWLGEGLGLVPRGTHDARLFVSPTSLRRVAAAHGWRLRGVVGTAPQVAATLHRRRLRLRFVRRITAEYAAWFELAG